MMAIELTWGLMVVGFLMVLPMLWLGVRSVVVWYLSLFTTKDDE